MVFCASANGIELGVLGMNAETNKFVQLTMEDSGRAEMPLVAKTNDER